jgi:hypothetical protein
MTKLINDEAAKDTTIPAGFNHPAPPTAPHALETAAVHMRLAGAAHAQERRRMPGLRHPGLALALRQRVG